LNRILGLLLNTCFSSWLVVYSSIAETLVYLLYWQGSHWGVALCAI